MKPTLMVSALAAAGLLATPLVRAADQPAAALAACCTAGDKDYPTHSGNLGNQGYSALTQINQANVKNLGPVWRTKVSAVPPTTPQAGAGTNDGGQQTTPIVVDGVIYLDTPRSAEHTSELQSLRHLVCRPRLEKLHA